MTYFYILLVAIFIIELCLAYSCYKFYLMIKKMDKTNKTTIVENGNAITETLRIIFDNLKRQTSKVDKLSGKHTEYQSRFHRLEQHVQRLLSKDKESVELPKEENKNERRNNKAD